MIEKELRAEIAEPVAMGGGQIALYQQQRFLLAVHSKLFFLDKAAEVAICLPHSGFKYQAASLPRLKGKEGRRCRHLKSGLQCVSRCTR